MKLSPIGLGRETKSRQLYKRRQIAEVIRKWPAGLQMKITSDVLAANLGPIM